MQVLNFQADKGISLPLGRGRMYLQQYKKYLFVMQAKAKPVTENRHPLSKYKNKSFNYSVS